MSSREARKTAARRARMDREALATQMAARRKRLRMLVAAVSAAVAVVAGLAAVSSGNQAAGAGKLVGSSFSRDLFAGIPQRGTVLGRPDAPVRLVEFADLQCPYCDEYALQALPTLVRDYVRTGELQMQFENLSFIGPGSVAAGRVAAAAARQNKLWNFVDLLYLNQGEENSGYVTPAYLRRLLQAIPGLKVQAALNASRAPEASAALANATDVATEDGVDATPSFLIGRAGSALRPFQPTTLTAVPFIGAIDNLMESTR